MTSNYLTELPTHIIGKHLKAADGASDIGSCCLCQCRDVKGFNREDVISKDFPDAGYLASSSGICIYCAATLGSDTYSIAICAWKPPYWLKRNVSECIVPKQDESHAASGCV